MTEKVLLIVSHKIIQVVLDLLSCCVVKVLNELLLDSKKMGNLSCIRDVISSRIQVNEAVVDEPSQGEVVLLQYQASLIGELDAVGQLLVGLRK